jgi:hypothetical protein
MWETRQRRERRRGSSTRATRAACLFFFGWSLATHAQHRPPTHCAFPSTHAWCEHGHVQRTRKSQKRGHPPTPLCASSPGSSSSQRGRGGEHARRQGRPARRRRRRVGGSRRAGNDGTTADRGAGRGGSGRAQGRGHCVAFLIWVRRVSCVGRQRKGPPVLHFVSSDAGAGQIRLAPRPPSKPGRPCSLGPSTRRWAPHRRSPSPLHQDGVPTPHAGRVGRADFCVCVCPCAPHFAARSALSAVSLRTPPAVQA